MEHQQARILIADDTSVNVQVLTSALSPLGYQIHAVSSGDMVLDAARELNPDLILLDVRMPIINGIQFLRQIRTQPEFDDVAVAIVTGDYFLSEDIQDELRRLRASVRFKPIWLEDVVALARTLTRR